MPEYHFQAVAGFDAPLYRHVVAASTFASLVLFLRGSIPGVGAASILSGHGDGMFAGLGDRVPAPSWRFFRAALLTTSAFSFACCAAAFRWAA
jgi:hypothetical protein